MHRSLSKIALPAAVALALAAGCENMKKDSSTKKMDASGEKTAVANLKTAAAASTQPSWGKPTGTVTFKDGVTTLDTNTLSGGTATFSTSSLVNGPHNITVVYGGDTNFSGSTSNVLVQIIGSGNSAVALGSSANPSRFGQGVTFTATLTSVAPGAGTPTGLVSYFDGSVEIGVTTSSAGASTFTTAGLAVGSHNITAVYRSGLGKGGNVKENQLSLPLTKPLGVKEVINTLRATGGADKESPGRADLIEDAAGEVSLGGERVGGERPIEQRVGCNLLPKGAQFGDTLGRGIPGDEGGVDGPDRNASHPIGMEVSFGERLVDAGLIRAERATALQQQSNALERGTRGQPARPYERRMSRRPSFAQYCVMQYPKRFTKPVAEVPNAKPQETGSRE